MVEILSEKNREKINSRKIIFALDCRKCRGFLSALRLAMVRILNTKNREKKKNREKSTRAKGFFRFAKSCDICACVRCACALVMYEPQQEGRRTRPRVST